MLELKLVGPKSENFAESGGGTGVHKERALISLEVFPVPAAECRETVDRNETLVSLPPESTHRHMPSEMWTN